MDKLRGADQGGTGDFAWKVPARARLAAHFLEAAKDDRIASLRAEKADLAADGRRQRADLEASARRTAAPNFAPPTARYPLLQGLVPQDPPVAALLPARCGSPGTRGVKQQLAQHAQQHARLLASEGKAPRPARVTRSGVPEGFHDPPSRTVSDSHQRFAGVRPAAHHEVPPQTDFRQMADFSAVWRPPVAQRRVHSTRDLA
jgi:hypothetical protein